MIVFPALCFVLPVFILIILLFGVRLQPWSQSKIIIMFLFSDPSVFFWLVFDMINLLEPRQISMWADATKYSFYKDHRSLPVWTVFFVDMFLALQIGNKINMRKNCAFRCKFPFPRRSLNLSDFPWNLRTSICSISRFPRRSLKTFFNLFRHQTKNIVFGA